MISFCRCAQGLTEERQAWAKACKAKYAPMLPEWHGDMHLPELGCLYRRIKQYPRDYLKLHGFLLDFVSQV